MQSGHMGMDNSLEVANKAFTEFSVDLHCGEQWIRVRILTIGREKLSLSLYLPATAGISTLHGWHPNIIVKEP